MTNATGKPIQVRMKNLLLASLFLGFKSPSRIMRTTAPKESREWAMRKWRQGEKGSNEVFLGEGGS